MYKMNRNITLLDSGKYLDRAAELRLIESRVSVLE